MQRLTYVLFQLDEALRYVDDGRLERLRLALLILDNAAELQVERRVRDELEIEDFQEHIRQQTLLVAALQPEGEREFPNSLAELVAWEPLTKAQKRSLDRLYDEKLRYLSERHDILDGRLAKVLSYLHRYRNEAYHEGRVRSETVRTAALILFEANCALLLSVFRVHSIASNEDYSWLEERFGVRGPLFGTNGQLEPLLERLRAPFLPTLESVVGTLGAHLTSRIDELWGDLDFIIDGSRIQTRADAFRIAQLYAAAERDEVAGAIDPDAYAGRWTLAAIDDLHQSIHGLGGAEDRLDAFSRFSDLEQRVEEFEREVRPLTVFVDRLVQDEIDQMRGK
jgi:hypothetical protein